MMAGKISFKTTVYVLLFSCSFIIMILSACMSPVDIDEFVKDERVDEIINVNKGNVVYLSIDSDNGLVAGNNKVTGLKNDKYYVIESEKDENNSNVATPVYPRYVYGPGLSNNELYFVNRVSGGSIINLKNYHTYKVRGAREFTGTVTVTNGTPATSNITNGTITIIPSSPTATITLGGLYSQYDGYEVMAVAVSPATLSSTTFNDTKTISSSLQSFPLEGKNTTVDYVFAKTTGTTIKTLVDFKVLKVIIKDVGGGTPDATINLTAIEGVTKPVAGVAPVTSITATAEYTGTITWNGNPTVFAAGTVYTATITLTPEPGYTLTGVPLNFFTVAGTSTSATNAANSGVITAVFPATDTTISNSVVITLPAYKGTPQTIISDTQYTGTVSWSPSTASTGGKFAAGTQYTATITLTPESGFTVYGVVANSFPVTGATTVTNVADSGIITAVFPATGAVPTGNVDVSITFTAIDEQTTVTPTGGTIAIGTLDGNSTVSLSLNITGGTYTSIKWYRNGTVISGLTDPTTLNLSNAPGNTVYLVVGIHVFTAVVDIGGKPYSAEFRLEVTN